MYYFGCTYAPSDYKKARELLKRVSEQGHVQATNDLADMFINGEGGQTDIDRAMKLYEENAKKKNHVAMNALVGLLFNASEEQSNSYKKTEV